jgi:CheY-like chemotaxis protein
MHRSGIEMKERAAIPEPMGRAPAVVPSAPAAGPDRSAKTILIVDDFVGVRMYHVSLLSRAGYRCETASNGSEALERLGAGRVDLVLLDLHMPTMAGREFIRRIRLDPMHATLPVLVITSDADPGDLSAHEEMKSVSVLGKPVLPRGLLDSVGQLVRR